MLIRNVRSKFDLDNARKIQQEMLNLQIENEKILEERVANYQNPNKAPPVPPQYKTNSEIQNDIFTLEREAITNLTNLGITASDALTVTTSLKNRKDGVANLFKLNKNFPYIKKDIGERFQPKLLDPSVILTYLDEVFYSIDETLGLYPKTYGGQYASAMDVTGMLPSPKSIIVLKDLVLDTTAIIDYANVSNFKTKRSTKEFELLIDRLDFLINNLPSQDAMMRIEALSTLERNKFEKIQDKLIRINRIPTSEFINNVIIELEEALLGQIKANNDNARNTASEVSSGGAFTGDERRINPDRILEVVGKIKNVLGGIDRTSEEALIAFNSRLTQIEKEFRGEFTLGEKSSGLTKAEAVGDKKEIFDKEVKEKVDYVSQKIKSLGTTDINRRLVQLLGYVDDEPPPNIFEEIKYGISTNSVRKIISVRIDENGNYEYDEIPSSTLISKNGQNYVLRKFLYFNKIRIPTIQVEVSPYIPAIPAIPAQPAVPAVDAVMGQRELKNKKGKSYKPKQYEPYVITPAKPAIPATKAVKRVNAIKAEYRYDIDNTVAPTVMAPEERYTLGQKRDLLRDEELPDLIDKIETKPEYNPKIDVRDRKIPEQGFGVSSKKSAFKSTRIKIGKGLEVEEQPRFKTFGKYIIHMPHLINDNVLNVKFPSGGVIPSIKPVQINNNFKEFINDLLETGKFDERHYNSLSKGERDHFMKIAKGANLISKLGVKQSKEDEDIEKKDVDRFELLKGEYDAGNNNEKMIKELRALVIKFIHNGKINKKQGMEFLMELSLV